MAFNFKESKDLANDALREFGIPVKVSRGDAAVGTGFGLFTANTARLDSAQGLQTGLSNRTMKLGAMAKAPEVGDTVVADKTTFTVREVTTLRPTTTTLLYTLELS